MKKMRWFYSSLSVLALCLGMGMCDVQAAESIDSQMNVTGNEDSDFKTLPRSYIFTSGVGGWGTELLLAENGTFTGNYHDSNMGDIGPGYPNGSVIICDFKGKFSEPRPVDQYTMSMRMESLEVENTPGIEYYEDDIRYIYSDPYGLANADEIMIYLPGTRIDDLPEDSRIWLISFLNLNTTDVFPENFYMLYNVNEGLGFVGTSEVHTDDQYIFVDSDLRYLTENEIRALSLRDINYAKNEIYARHGRKFMSRELQDYFNSKSWYRGTVEPENFTESMLNQYEIANAALLSEIEFAISPDGYQLDQQ